MTPAVLGPTPRSETLATVTPPSPPHRDRACLRSLCLALCAGVSLVVLAMAQPAAAASTKTDRGSVVAATPATAPDHMVLEANQVVYDDHANTVTAVGGVTIYYKGNTLIARKVTYERANGEVIAEGDVRLTDKDGNVMTSPKLDVTQGFTDGFVESLRIESIDRSRFAAESATRRNGVTTVFEKGVYSACQTCVNEPEKPPFWQIKAVRIIHDQQEKTVTYEDAKLEMLGVPIAYVPFFQHPDPSEKRKTGFLLPRVIDSNTLGLGVQVPFYWAPVADWDATLSPVAMSRQGLLADVEVRHRFDAGMVTVHAYGINQIQRQAFVGTTGDRKWRGAFNSTGTFTLNENWNWGWNQTIVTDRRFLSDYHLTSNDNGISTVFLTGQGLKNYFEARLYKFNVTTDDNPYDRAGNLMLWGAGARLQDKQTVVHPVIDYDFVGEQAVAGGEVSGHTNFTSLSRTSTDIDTYGRVYGIAGTFSRVSGILSWRRQFIDDYGQVFTPSASLRGDVFLSETRDKGMVSYVQDGTLGRVMPTLGLDYAYPFIASTMIGAHTFEPLAQLLVRPNEQWTGKLPNEDAQSVVFDDTTLFRADKFSGWDRAEGGTRLNLGGRYTFQGVGGGTVSTLFGRSVLLAGTNSFAYPSYDALIRQAQLGRPVPITAFGSGLEDNVSDWVGRVALDSSNGFRVSAQGRFGDDLRLNRADVQASGTSGPLSASVTWAYQRTPQVAYDLLRAYRDAGYAGAQAILDALRNERSEIQTASNLRLTPNWRLFGGVRYDLKDSYLSGDNAGIGYDNDSFSISLSYNESSYSTTEKNIRDQTVYLRFGFRTLGDGQLSNSLASSH